MKNQLRKMSPPRLLSLAFLGVMIAILGGCGGDTETASTDAVTPAATNTAVEAAPEPVETSPVAPAVETGVHGRVVFDGPRPQRKELNTGSDPKCALLHGGEPLFSESRVVSEDGGVQHVFVYVKNAPEGDYPVQAEPAVLDQTGCTYVPHILAIRAGQTVNVQNSDETIHNIRSYPKSNKPFNISQPKPGVRERQFPEPEMAVKIKCDFHPWMTAYVFAMDHPFFAVTDENGHFSISNLPDGEYVLGVWHEVWGEQETALTVSGGIGEANFTFSE